MTKKNIPSFVIFFVIVSFILLSCSNGNKNNYSQYLEKCLTNNWTKIDIQDSLREFEISIPDSWAYSKVLNKEFSGLIISDTSIFYKHDSLILLAVNAFSLNESLNKYVDKEVANMKKDSIDIINKKVLSRNEIHIITKGSNSFGRRLTDIHIYRRLNQNRFVLVTLSTDEINNPKTLLCKYWTIINSIKCINTLKTQYVF